MKKEIRIYAVDIKGGRLKRVEDWPCAVPEEWKNAALQLAEHRPGPRIFIYCCFYGEAISYVFTASSPKTIPQLRDRFDQQSTIDVLINLSNAAVELKLPPIIYAKFLKDNKILLVEVDATKLKT